MKYEGLTLEIINLIDDYKISKIKKVVNGDSSSKNSNKKKGIKGVISSLGESEELTKKYSNILEQVNVVSVIEYLEKSLINNNCFFFCPISEIQVIEWRKKIYNVQNEWKEIQVKNDEETLNLKIKISNTIKKSLKGIDGYTDNEKQIKTVIDRALENSWISFNLTEKLNAITKDLNTDAIKLIDGFKAIWLADLDKISNDHDYAKWLDWASRYAGKVGFSTHIAKLTHSSIEGASSIYFDKQEESSCYLTTTSLVAKEVDVSQTSNEFAPIGKLLKLQNNDGMLGDRLSHDNVSDLKALAKDEAQLESWRQGFLTCFKEKSLSSHSLAKQLYFPISSGYHLLSPLASSSLDQAIFLLFKYDEKSIEIGKQRWAKKYHPEINISYPDIAVLKVTASNHGNASPLNGVRGGKRYLFPSMPPYWKSRLKPPIHQESLFYGEFDYRAGQSAKNLQKYLLALRDQKGNKEIRDHIKKYVNEIIDTLFYYVAEIQGLVNQSDWNKPATKLKEAHQLWLDPYRKDEIFQQKRKSGDWQEQVCNDFGRWLNIRLEHEKMKFSKIESKSWAKLLMAKLREFERDLEVMP